MWAPAPQGPSEAIDALVDLLQGVVTPPQVEFLLNIVMFVPLSLLGTFLFRPGLLRWVIVGAVASSVIEAGQALFLPSRVPTVNDIAANTTGALVGALLALAAIWSVRPRS